MSGAKTDAEQRTLSVLVSRASLSSSMGPRKEKTRSFLQGLQLWKRVEVEATAHDSSDSVFYAPFPHDEGSATLLSERGHRPIATQFLTVDPYSMRVPDLVSDHDDFELSFVGMNVPQGGPHISNAHDLLLYSTRAHVFPDAEDEARPHPTDGDDDDDVDVGADADETTSRVLRSAAMSELSVTDANGIDLLPCDVPFIHYDPATDGREESGMANAFLPVPASKAVIRQHNGKTEVSFVPLRFSVFEVDKVTSAHARAVARSSSVNALARRSGLIVPSSDVISSAVAVANSMGRAKLRRYKRPDHVMSKDMEFRLVSKARAGASGCSSTSDDLPSKKYAGTYLRYGYYFFLRDKVDARLYAQTDASSQNVPLLMRRQGYGERAAQQGEKEFLALCGVTYVVMKVSAGCTPHARQRVRALAMENRARLEHVLHVTDALEKLAGMI